MCRVTEGFLVDPGPLSKDCCVAVIVVVVVVVAVVFIVVAVVIFVIFVVLCMGNSMVEFNGTSFFQNFINTHRHIRLNMLKNCIFK